MARVNIIEWIAKKLRSLTGIAEDGDTATHAISAGKYVIWKGNPCKASSAISIGDTLSSSNLTPLTNGVCNDLADNKVNKTDIVDNLTTNDATKVLSAAQGYALNSKFATLEKITMVEGTKELASGSFGTLATRSFDPGAYLILCTVSFQDATAGVRIVLIDTTETNNNYVGNSAIASGRACLQFFRPITLTATTTLYFRAYQNSGGDITASWRYSFIKL